MKTHFFFLFIFIILTTAMGSPLAEVGSPGAVFLEARTDSPDVHSAQWAFEFSETLEEIKGVQYISKQALEFVAGIMNREDMPEKAAEAAYLVYEVAFRAERSMRQGEPLPAISQNSRNHINAIRAGMSSTFEKPENVAHKKAGEIRGISKRIDADRKRDAQKPAPPSAKENDDKQIPRKKIE